ncbi:MAG: DUF4129 domain-containing protein [Acidothermaceae bacterium]
MPPDSASRRREIALVAAVVVALVLVAIGAGAHGSARINFHGGRDIAVVVVTLAALGLVGGAIATFNGRRLRRQLANTIALACILAAVIALSWLLVSLLRGGGVPARPRRTATSSNVPLGQLGATSGSQHHPALSPVPVAAGSLVVVLLVLAVVLGFVAHRRNRRVEQIDHDEAARGAIYAAADAGADAMRDVADPRAAIISCYAAMEHVLAGAGIRRLVAETPGDLLARSVELGIAPRAARRLTELFLEARYSTHPMSEGDRDAARAALAQLQTPRPAAAPGLSGVGGAA